MTTADAVRATLRGINDPCSVAAGTPIDLDSMGLIKDVQVNANGHVRVDVRLTSPSCVMLGYFTHEIEQAAGTVEGIHTVEVTFDTGFDWEPTMMNNKTKHIRALRLQQNVYSQGRRRTVGAPEREESVL